MFGIVFMYIYHFVIVNFDERVTVGLIVMINNVKVDKF